MRKLITKLKQFFCLHTNCWTLTVNFGKNENYSMHTCKECDHEFITKGRG